MTIITRKRAKNFAIIPNAIADDQRLSLEARGLLVYLLAKPDDWCVDVKNIRNIGNIGRDKAYRLLRELKQAGYINIEEKRDKKGRVVEYDYLVHDSALIDTLPFGETPQQNEPLNSLLTDLPHTEKQEADLPRAENTDDRISNKSNNKIPPFFPPNSPNFKQLWDLWPDKNLPQRKDIAEDCFCKLSPSEQSLATKYAATFVFWYQTRKLNPPLITYLKKKLFIELDGAPPFDKDGYFRITPEFPEWLLWLNDIKNHWGEKAVEDTKTRGWIIRKKRYPEKSTKETV